MTPVYRRGLGWKRDPPKPFGAKPDHDAAPTLGTAPPPQSASNRNLVVSVLDQGQIGSCVAHSISQAVRMAHVREGVRGGIGSPPQLMSRLFGYYMSRAEDGQQSADDGTYLRSFFQALNSFGFCPESVYPYDTNKVNLMPPAAAFRAAFDQHAPTVYQKIMTAGQARIDDIKRAIAAGYGVCFGTDVSVPFTQDDLGSGPLLPPVGLEIAGGHALCAVAYDGDAFTIVNSWGTDFGDGGFCTFDAAYLAWENTTDCWLVQTAPAYSEAP